MKLFGFTCTYNEAEMVPYVMPYVEALGYDKFIVFDNLSTDNTVEMLKKYDFVDVISYDSEGKFDDKIKALLQKQAYEKCKEAAKDDEVWMTWTDFDEVIAYNSDVPFKTLVKNGSDTYRYNCFYKRMINLFPPYGNKDFFNGGMVHTYHGIRGSYWTGGGMKPLMFCVNRLPDVLFYPGNHYALSFGNSEPPKPFENECEIYAFHLKFINKEILLRKWEGYAAKGKEVYVEQIKNFDAIYKNLEGFTFPLEQYMMADGMGDTLCRKGPHWSGLKKL